MSNLLQTVLEAHGGLTRWNGYNQVRATIVTGGNFWALKGLVQDPLPRKLTVKLHEQWTSAAPFGGPDMFSEFTPDRVAILKTYGAVVLERTHPRNAFERHTLNTAWDPLHRAYFGGYALWTYQTTPFLLAGEGVQTKEIDPWHEGDETWRVLRATFPNSMATHCTTQDFFFGSDCLLRRHDYNVDVAGGFAAAQLMTAYTQADGIKLPAKRRAYTRGADHRPELDSLMVSIDITDVHFE
jgi:hypothetical protein